MTSEQQADKPWQGRWRQHPFGRERGSVPEHEHAQPHKRVRKHDDYPAHQHPCAEGAKP